jgi:hypothetical protein
MTYAEEFFKKHGRRMTAEEKKAEFERQLIDIFLAAGADVKVVEHSSTKKTITIYEPGKNPANIEVSEE